MAIKSCWCWRTPAKKSFSAHVAYIPQFLQECGYTAVNVLISILIPAPSRRNWLIRSCFANQTTLFLGNCEWWWTNGDIPVLLLAVPHIPGESWKARDGSWQIPAQLVPQESGKMWVFSAVYSFWDFFPIFLEKVGVSLTLGHGLQLSSFLGSCGKQSLLRFAFNCCKCWIIFFNTPPRCF